MSLSACSRRLASSTCSPPSPLSSSSLPFILHVDLSAAAAAVVVVVIPAVAVTVVVVVVVGLPVLSRGREGCCEALEIQDITSYVVVFTHDERRGERPDSQSVGWAVCLSVALSVGLILDTFPNRRVGERASKPASQPASRRGAAQSLAHSLT